MTRKELAGSITKGIIGGIFTLLVIIYSGVFLIAIFAAIIKKLSELFGG
jgi:hypothetical protein